MANHQRDLAKERFWRDAHRRREQGGMTIREFCRREGLKESAYHFWGRELKRRDSDFTASRSRRTPLEPARTSRRPPLRGRVRRAKNATITHRAMSDSSTTARFVPVTLAAAVDGAQPVAEIILPGAWVVRVTRGCDRETLGIVLAVLSSVPSGARGEEQPC